MNTKKFSKRKAISPVLATVILIAITLVAGVAIAGFAFGLFGTLGSSANVSVAAGTTCVVTTHICALSVSNSGTADGTVTACNIGGIGNTAAGVNGAATFKVPAGATINPFHCTFTASPAGAAAGQSVSGTITVNGNSISWAGTYT